MRSKKIPPFIPWLAAGAVLFFCSYIPTRYNRETTLKICAASSLIAAFLWLLLPEFMKNHRHKLYGIGLILIGAYMTLAGMLFGGSRFGGMDGLLAAVIGIGFLIIT